MLNKAEAKALIQTATSLTKCHAVAVISINEDGTTRFANSEISQNVIITDASMSLTLYDGKKQATCSTNDLTPMGIEQLVKNAEEMLKFVPEGAFGAFPLSTENVTECISDGRFYPAFNVKNRAEYIKQGVALLEPDFSAAGALTLTYTGLAIGDSTGGFRYANYEAISFNTVVSHTSGADGAGECVSYTDIPDIVGCFKKAQDTARAALNPISPELGGFTVILSPSAFGDLVSFMTMMLSAKSVDDGVSFARGKLGEKLFGENLNVRDDVMHNSLCPLPFDVEGNPRRVLSLVENGKISAFLYDNKTASKHGVEPTGHAVSSRFYSGAVPTNIVVDGGDMSLDEIIASTEKGIFINEFHYSNFVNARNLQVTGLTRNGTFLIENGKLTKPISTMRFTESLLDAFNNISAISREIELVSGFGASLVPAVRIENFHFTSKA